MSGAVLEPDDNVGSSHDADVDAGYDDQEPANDLAVGSENLVDGTPDDSHEADIAAGYEGNDKS